jgi:hypothetical protein
LEFDNGLNEAMLEGNKTRDFLKRALAGAVIASVLCFFYFFFFCNVLFGVGFLGADAFILIILAGAFAGAVTSFFGRKLPGPPTGKE